MFFNKPTREGPFRMSDQKNRVAKALSPKPRRLCPPRWLLGLWGLIAVAIGLFLGAGVLGDRAIANLVSLALTIVAVIALVLWFALGSGFRKGLRLTVLLVSVLGVLAFLGFFRLDHFSGEMTPVFAYRYTAKPDRLLESGTEGTDAHVDLRSTTKDDFPQFLGPDRSCACNVELARDWASHPPKLVWRQAIGAGWSAFAVVNGHAVTLEQRGDTEMVACYDVKSGRRQWARGWPARFETAIAGIGPRSTPTLVEGMVYVQGATGRLMCLDGTNGQTVWEIDLLKEYGITAEDEAAHVPHGRSASPLVAGRLVVVPIGGPADGRKVSLAAFDKKTGKRVWESGACQVSYCSPAAATLGGVEQALIVNEASASGHELKTGKLLWEHPWAGHSNRDPNVSQVVAVPPDRVFLSKGYGLGGSLLKLVPQPDGTFKPEEIWHNPKSMLTKFTNVAVLDKYVYGLCDGTLECIALEDGKRAWKQGRYQQGQILRAGDLLVVLGEDGAVSLVEATPERPNHVLGRVQAIEGMTWNNPALYGPYLLVRNDHEAACFKLPLASN
jgi:outer membrane protein assembly factor BamB